jgi:hypothetical protein
MTAHDLGPASVSATKGGAPKSDQLASEIDSEKNTTANANQAQLISAIKTHIAAGDKLASKADDHYISAGQYLAQLKKEHAGNWAEWEELLKTKVGISTGRASELMQIANGTKTVGEVRAVKAESMKRLRARGSSLRGEESADTKGRKQPATKVKVKPDELVAAAAEVGIPESVIKAHGPQNAEALCRIVQGKKKKRAEEAKEKLAVEIERLASKLIELDRDGARELHDLLWKDARGSVFKLTCALARGLGLDDDDDDGSAS